MAVSQPANFNIQQFADAGQLLVGGRLYTYAYGTTALKTAYTDPAGTVPHTYTPDGAGGQYIALNARGELPAPLYLGAGSYDLTLKRADGTTVWTRKADGVDNRVVALADSTGSSSIGFVQNGSGAVPSTVLDELRSRVRIEQFGGKGDGVFDNTTAIARAIAALPSGGTIEFGPAVYVATNFAVSTSGICLRGAGVNATTLKLKDGQNSSFIAFTDIDGGEVANLTVDGNLANNPSGTDKVALIGARCRNVSFHDFHIKDFNGKGVGFDGGAAGSETRDNRIDSFSVTNCAEQAVIIDGSSGTNERTTISNFAIYDTGHAGIAVNDGATDVTIANGVMNLNNAVWDCVSTRNVKRVSVSNVIGQRGRNGLYVQYDTAPCEDINVSGCQFIANQQNGVLVLSSKRVTLSAVTARNNNQGNVGAPGFNITKAGAGQNCEYTTLSACLSVDDQATPTQTYGYLIQAAPTKTLMAGCSAKGNLTAATSIAGTVAVGELLILPGGGVDMRDMLKWTVTSAYGNLLEFWRTTEANPRFTIDALGQMQWGAGGAAAPDVNLYRPGVNQLKTDDKFMAAGGLAVGLSAAGVQVRAATPGGNTAYMLALYNAADNSLFGYVPIYAAPW